MDARSVLGAKGAAHPLESSTPSKPKAAALRSRVPTLPGSCTASNARIRRPFAKISAACQPGCSNTPNTSWLVLVPESFCATGSVTSTVLPAKASSSGVWARAFSVAYRVCRVQPRASSRQSLGPSAKNRPSAVRSFSSSRRRQAYLILAFSRLVMVSIWHPRMISI